MNFMFTTLIKHEVSHQIVCLEQKILKKSAEYKALYYFFSIILLHIS